MAGLNLIFDNDDEFDMWHEEDEEVAQKIKRSRSRQPTPYFKGEVEYWMGFNARK